MCWVGTKSEATGAVWGKIVAFCSHEEHVLSIGVTLVLTWFFQILCTGTWWLLHTQFMQEDGWKPRSQGYRLRLPWPPGSASLRLCERDSFVVICKRKEDRKQTGTHTVRLIAGECQNQNIISTSKKLMTTEKPPVCRSKNKRK